MKKLIALLCLGLISCSKIIDQSPHQRTPNQKEIEYSNQKIESFQSDYEHFEKIAEKSNLALRSIFYIATLNLKKNGFNETAKEIENGWEKFDGRIVRIIQNERGIGDFKPMSEWLQKAYEKIEEKLGYQLCLALRLSDIKTINHGLYVLINLCEFEFNDFKEHFVNDGRYRGLLPVISYWATIMACSIGTYGIGYFFICSPIGMLVELGVDKKVAPYLAPKLYKLACD